MEFTVIGIIVGAILAIGFAAGIIEEEEEISTPEIKPEPKPEPEETLPPPPQPDNDNFGDFSVRVCFRLKPLKGIR